MNNIIYLSIGSNLGDKKKILADAINALRDAGIKITKISSLYETEPVGKKDQPMFYNACVLAETILEPLDLLKKIKEIEKKLGRKDTNKWGPRIIDIDILFYNNIILSINELKIPHPEILNRKFVLVPLDEIAKNYIHPVVNQKIRDILEKSSFNQKVTRTGAL